MGRIPAELRNAIARNIKLERLKKYGRQRGTAKTCAEDFGVSPQQWSPWECGKRTPDEIRLKEMADFFGVSVTYLRRPEQQFQLTFEQFLKTPNIPPDASLHVSPDSEQPHPHGESCADLIRAMARFFESGFDVVLSCTPRKPSAKQEGQSKAAEDALEALREFVER